MCMPADLTIRWVQPFPPVDPFAKKERVTDDMGNPIMDELPFFRLPRDWRETGYFKDGLPNRKPAAARTDSNASTVPRYPSESQCIIRRGQI